MRSIHAALVALALPFILAGCSSPQPAAAPPLASETDILAVESASLDPRDAEWNQSFAPFNVIGNIYYVGPTNVSSYLITTDDGHFLIDGGFAQSAPQIIANVAALGFDIADVKYLLNTHAHNDHAGGLARLQRASGATMAASPADRVALQAGRVGYGPSADWAFPPVRVDRVIADGDTLTLGGVTLTAIVMPGHTAGCTSWMMDVAGADGAQHRAFFHCSSTVGGQSLSPPDYPTIVEDFRATFARVRTLQADILLPNHGNFIDLPALRARQIAGDANAFVDAGALQSFNDATEAAFNTELERQNAATR
ncbi:metallo-beta-lactamase precursor [alpha proteobacterium U9-1i]|nr:metallo-beta-lactamase precursor [alpha proteobacterium U9-1i]